MTKFEYRNIISEKIINQIKLMYQNNYIPSHIELSKDWYDLVLNEQVDMDFELGSDKLFGLELRLVDDRVKYLQIPAKYKINL